MPKPKTPGASRLVENMRLRDLAEAQAEYISLLEEECKSLGSVAYVHGWHTGQEKIDKGIELRARIANCQDPATNKDKTDG